MSGRVAWVAKRLATSAMSDDAVLAGVVDADVEDVGALLDLVAGHGHAGVPVVGQHGLAELLGAVGVGALADDQERRRPGRRARGCRSTRSPAPHSGCAAGPASGPGSASTTAARCSGVVPQQPPTTETPNSVTKRAWCSASCVGREVVVHLAVDHRGQAGVGQARDRHPAVLGEVAQVLAHLRGPGGAVEADDVGPQGVEGGEGGADLGAQQHAAGQLDGDLDLERHLPAERRPWPAGSR